MICTTQTLPAACLTPANVISHPVVDQIRRGDTSGVFGWAFREVFPALRARLMRKGLDPASVGELFTDAVLDFIAAAQKNTAFDGRNPAGYLWRICLNKHADFHRARSRTLDTGLYFRLFGALPDPDTPLMAGALHAQLRRLPKSYREILRLYYFEELSCAQIAARLGSTADSVKERKCRAIKRLRAAFH